VQLLDIKSLIYLFNILRGSPMATPVEHLFPSEEEILIECQSSSRGGTLGATLSIKHVLGGEVDAALAISRARGHA